MGHPDDTPSPPNSGGSSDHKNPLAQRRQRQVALRLGGNSEGNSSPARRPRGAQRRLPTQKFGVRNRRGTTHLVNSPRGVCDYVQDICAPTIKIYTQGATDINLRVGFFLRALQPTTQPIPMLRLARGILTLITMGAYPLASAAPALVAVTPMTAAKLRVPLLKLPLYFGHVLLRVNRPYNEDRYAALVLDINDSKVFLFAVFDGHGGSECSTWLQDNLAALVELGDDINMDQLARDYAKNIGGYWRRWYKHRKSHMDSLRGAPLELSDASARHLNLRLRLPALYLDADYQFCLLLQKLGLTCTNAFFETVIGAPTDYYFMRNTVLILTIAHVGDTKAILVDREGVAHALTQPHHPLNPIELERLNKYATAFMTDSFGEERFIALANTRAFGDVKFKQMGVSAEPEISQLVVGDAQAVLEHLTAEEIAKYTIGGLGGNELFLVLCLDGITDVLTDQEIADIVMVHYNNRGTTVATPQLGAEEVVKFVEYVGGDDNATCLVVRLNGWGMWPVTDRTGELRQSRLADYNPRRKSG